MGLDIVELVMRTEEVFAVDLPDKDCNSVKTVGDLYGLVLSKLQVGDSLIDAAPPKGGGRSRMTDQFPGKLPWSAEDVWATLVEVIHHQLHVDYGEITANATLLEDLACD